MKKLDIENILSKICVSRPYFAFKEIYQTDETTLIAPVKKEQPRDNGISYGEVARHLAILGSCVLANRQQDKRFYLVDNAQIEKNGDIKNCKGLKVKSIFISFSERRAKTINYLLDKNDKEIYKLEIEYLVFKPKVFEKIFQRFRLEYKKPFFNPYKRFRIFDKMKVFENKLTAILPQFKPQVFAGHFDNYPMLPAGACTYLLDNSIAYFLEKRFKFEHDIINGDMKINKPIFNAYAEFELSLDRQFYDSYHFTFKLFNKYDTFVTGNITVK